MTDTRFKELVNLYLDREINPRDFNALRTELADNERKRQFESIRRIHNAERQAMALLCGCSQEENRRDTLTKRAARAINDARLRFEERRKGLVLLGQFGAATATIAVTVGLLYHDSVQALEVESSIESDMAVTPDGIRDSLLAQLNSNSNNSRLVMDESGRTLAIVSYMPQGEVQVQALQTVPESNIFRLGQLIESARPHLPEPSELLENRSPTIPVRQLPGTAAPIVLVEETQGAGAIVGYAY